MKVAINKCFGGFGLSDEAYEKLISDYGWTVTNYDESGNYVDKDANLVKSSFGFGGSYYPCKFKYYDNEFRTHLDVIAVIESLGSRADGDYAELKIVEIPDGIEFEIDEYDGIESVHEVHGTWY